MTRVLRSLMYAAILVVVIVTLTHLVGWGFYIFVWIFKKYGIIASLLAGLFLAATIMFLFIDDLHS